MRNMRVGLPAGSMEMRYTFWLTAVGWLVRVTQLNGSRRVSFAFGSGAVGPEADGVEFGCVFADDGVGDRVQAGGRVVLPQLESHKTFV